MFSFLGTYKYRRYHYWVIKAQSWQLGFWSPVIEFLWVPMYCLQWSPLREVTIHGPRPGHFNWLASLLLTSKGLFGAQGTSLLHINGDIGWYESCPIWERFSRPVSSFANWGRRDETSSICCGWIQTAPSSAALCSLCRHAGACYFCVLEWGKG